jgi:Cu(I)/Ag(I) efflux system membrane fusion protein
MAWVKVGDKVSYTVQSIPGKTFEGTISFIDPIINAQTRVATARVEVKNDKNNLKPEMFVTGILKNNLSTNNSKELIIPKSAILWTGERSVIYVKNKAENAINFTLREVTLGASLGNAYIIKSGLETGEEIVVNGTFTVDAASQLAGKPSMMNLDGGKAATDHSNHNNTATINNSTDSQTNMETTMVVSKQFQQQLNNVFEIYLNLKDALVADNGNNAKTAAQNLLKQLSKVNMKLLTNNEAHTQWMAIHTEITKLTTYVSETYDIEIQRDHFKDISTQLIKAIKLFGINKTVYEQFCPMANDDHGAYWLSTSAAINNPYFGSKMLKCGSTTTIINNNTLK